LRNIIQDFRIELNVLGKKKKAIYLVYMECKAGSLTTVAREVLDLALWHVQVVGLNGLF
jgi:hypothetical protein